MYSETFPKIIRASELRETQGQGRGARCGHARKGSRDGAHARKCNAARQRPLIGIPTTIPLPKGTLMQVAGTSKPAALP